MFSTAEALLCGTFTPLGQVQIGPLDSLSGQLVAYQIPDNIISTLKLADASVTMAKLSASSVNDSKVVAGAGILESKLNLDFSTTDLNTDIGLNAIDIASNLALILLREEFANKDIANGYLGLDASAKVPLSKLNPLTNAQIAAGAGILESKLALSYGTQGLHDDIQTRALLATYLAHNHSIADPTQVDHANLLNVLANQHHSQAHTLASHSTKAHSELTDILADQHHNKQHDIDGADHTGTLSWAKVNKTGANLTDIPTRNHQDLQNRGANDHHNEAHTLASHSTKAHSELTDVLTSQHHVRYADSEAKAACVSDAVYGSGWDTVTDVAPSKNALYDKLKAIQDWPYARFWFVQNGTTFGVATGGAIVTMPSNDNDCGANTSIHLPSNWPSSTQAYLKVLYSQSGADFIYSVTWRVAAYGVGEWAGSYNILNLSTSYDFAAVNPSQTLAINSVDLGTTLSAGDNVGVRIQSDALNGKVLWIYHAWIEFA